MAHYAYLEGTANGRPLDGDVTQTGREGQIRVLGASHFVETSGGAWPPRPHTHGAYVITKAVDRSSAYFYKALIQAESLALTLRYFTSQTGRDGAGLEVNHYTVALRHARVAWVRQYLLDVEDPDSVRYPPMEQVAFRYESALWRWEDGGVENEAPSGFRDRR